MNVSQNGVGKTAVSQPTQPIIRLQDVGRIYTTGSGNFTALQNINLDIYRGEFLGIIGKSGAGKTTLLNMISGVSEITSGTVHFLSSASGTSERQQPTCSAQRDG